MKGSKAVFDEYSPGNEDTYCPPCIYLIFAFLFDGEGGQNFIFKALYPTCLYGTRVIRNKRAREKEEGEKEETIICTAGVLQTKFSKIIKCCEIVRNLSTHETHHKRRFISCRSLRIFPD